MERRRDGRRARAAAMPDAASPSATAPVPEASMTSASSAAVAPPTAPVPAPVPPATELEAGASPSGELARTQRGASAADGTARVEMEWMMEDEGWVPTTARLHAGKTRFCAVCHAALQYTAAASWDEYLQSDEYLRHLQENLLSDAFISSLICGEAAGGDLPMEHRMHKNRKLKCRQNVHDHFNMTCAGLVDSAPSETGSVRILEEMLLDALPTPVFALVLERRLAVVSHSTKVVCKRVGADGRKKLPRDVTVSPANIELHYLAIQTLSAVLQFFDYGNENAVFAISEVSRLLACFPVLSLFSYWSPAPKCPEEPLAIAPDMVEASSFATSPRLHAAKFAVDGNDATYWQSQARPSTTTFSVRCPGLANVSSISIRWHLKCFPKDLVVEYRMKGSEEFISVAKKKSEASLGPSSIETKFPEGCEEIRLVMQGIPSSNRNSCFAIEQLSLNVPIRTSLFVDPGSTLSGIAHWLLDSLEHSSEDIEADAIGALRAWSLATASLSSTLLFAEMLMRIKNHRLLSKRTDLVAFAIGQARMLIEGIQAYQLDRIEQVARGDSKKASNESRMIRALFDPSCCSSGVTIEDGGLSARTRETSYQYAAVNVGISSGCATWKFRLENDTLDDEMTCFGAAIIPVTISGYDSSPSLWMLRGYNGNLYARGHKLSRSIGKVHPGDVVQIDVDMMEGTLAYKINDTDYGVVFTDLAGHEVYPAVSFYGSGKVITLLGVEKCDDVIQGACAVDPVFLMSLKECHHSVGYGTFGKGHHLGYAGDNALGSIASNVIQIAGEQRQRSLSTHPPSNGDADVLYDLAGAYDRLQGAVAINDDVPNELLQQRAISLTFSIFGDGAMLWQSQPVTQSQVLEEFDISIRNVRMLRLVVTCAESNRCAHAIWVDPYVVPREDWECPVCGVQNRGASKECSVCLRGLRESVELLVEPMDAPSAVDDTKVGKDEDNGSNADSSFVLGNLANTIIKAIFELTQIHQTDSGSKLDKQADQVENVGFDQPFCRQPCDEVFNLLVDLVDPIADATSNSAWKGTHDTMTRTTCALGLLESNLESLACYDVTTAEIGIRDVTLAKVVRVLEGLSEMRQIDGNDGSPVQMAAAKTLVAGLPILYSHADKLKLLLVLMKQHFSKPLSPSSPRYFVLSHMLQTLSSPGPDGIKTCFAPIAETCFQETGSHEKSQEIVGEEVLALLVGLACRPKAIGFSANGANAGSPDLVEGYAFKVLQTFQLVMLAEAVEFTTQGIARQNENTAYADSRRIQDATVKFSSMLLQSCTGLLQRLVQQHADEAFSDDASVAETKSSIRLNDYPILSHILPWMVSCLCLLRRQAWLACPMLPGIAKFMAMLDQFASELSVVRKAEARLRKLEMYKKARSIEFQEMDRMLAADKSLAAHHQAAKPMYNVFKQLYTGDKDHFEGQIGFQFEAVSTFYVIALGRSVNPVKNGGQLVRQHAVRLWDEATQSMIAHIVVNAASRKDMLGYAVEPLPVPVRITRGKLYRLTTQEYANGGDPWYKKENLPDEEYDPSYIKILRDCYASGSTGFPNSQNLSGAAYGVPTFLVEGEDPLDKIPRLIPPSGHCSLKFSLQKKAPSVSVSHSGTSVHISGGGCDVWRSCLLQTAMFSGVHAVDFIVKSSRSGGVSPGHVCIGLDCNVNLSDPLRDGFFLGANSSSLGWMPSIGALWVAGKRISYGERIPTVSGDILTMIVDFDQRIVSFSRNGDNMGIAVGPAVYHPVCVVSDDWFKVLGAGVSIFSPQDTVDIRPCGIAGSTLRVHWLLDLHVSLASLAGRIASTLIAGHPIDAAEAELLPWLQAPLFSGGVSGTVVSQGDSLDWDAMFAEVFEADRTSEARRRVAPLAMEQASRMLESGFEKRHSFVGDMRSDDASFLDDLTTNMHSSGPAARLISWLEASLPDKSFLCRFGSFSTCERRTIAALIKHAPAHIREEVQAVTTTWSVRAEGANRLQLTPSDDMAFIWKRVLMLRHFLIKTRQEYRAQGADANSSAANVPHSSINMDGAAGEARISAKISDMEMAVCVPREFGVLVAQMAQRAEFLCKLNPPSERERMSVESQVALSNLAEKWSSQTTPPSLEPMLERWRSLRESDSSKWSGVVEVLRAQHRWKERRASIHLAGQENKTPDLLELSRQDEENSQPRSNQNGFEAMVAACELYIRNGHGAPPEILNTLLERRLRRSESRVFGLDAMKTILSTLGFDSARHNAVIFLRPAFRGVTDEEKESRDVFDGQIVAETFRATARHHYLKGLEGCTRQTLQRVERSFWRLYTVLGELVGVESCVDTPLKQALMCSWGLDFEPRDHQHLLRSGILVALHDEFAVSSIVLEAAEDQKLLASCGTDMDANRWGLNWHPISEDFVQRGALSSGYVTKRDIQFLLLRAPRFATSRGNLLVEPSASWARETASSMALQYTRLLSGLRAKMTWCRPMALGRKVLQFCMTNAGAGPGASKNSQVGYCETPSLGETKDFTIELWVNPTDLGGYRAIRSDNGFHTGSVSLELVDRGVQLCVNGNHPREQRFHAARIGSHTWTHIAVVYDSVGKCASLFVNGHHTESKHYDQVGEKVVFRQARIGCWVTDSDAQGATVADVAPQRCFKGSMAELRVWRVARLGEQISRDFQLCVPHDVAAGARQCNLLGLWHMDEGEGVCVHDRILPVWSTTQRTVDSQGKHGAIMTCQWGSLDVPAWSTKKIDELSGQQWIITVRNLSKFQRVVRSELATRFEKMLEAARGIVEMDQNPAQRCDWEEGSESDDGLIENERSDPLEKTKIALCASTDDRILLRRHSKRAAWIVFKFLAHISLCGIHDRRDNEATVASAAAKVKRKQRMQRTPSEPQGISSPLQEHAARAAGLTFDEEDSQSQSAEAASDAAKLAASSRQLEEPGLQILWFSNEMLRKVLEVVTNELLIVTSMIRAGGNLARAQRMVRSTSTPMKSAGVPLQPQKTVIADVGRISMGVPRNSSNHDGLEALELEMRAFEVLTFLLAQSKRRAVLMEISRPHILQELLQLLRLSSPRSQRVVKLLLREMCSSGAVKPHHVCGILGSETILIDLLLDQVAESVCNTAVPIPACAGNIAQGSSISSTEIAPVSESLSNPVGFRSGQIFLSAASESVALLRLLLNNRYWHRSVTALLSAAVDSVAPVLSRRRSHTEQDSSDLRLRASIVRAVGALCVLGSHTDCLRIGGRVHLATKKDVCDDRSDDDFSFSKVRSGSVCATLIELNARSASARVVFEASDESEPSHNVQEVSLESISPIEEICLPPDVPFLTAEMVPVILKLASLEESETIANFDDLWRVQIRSRALLALELILRQSEHDSVRKLMNQAMADHLLASALQPVSLSSFVSLPLLQDRARMILRRLIEASTPLGEAMYSGLSDPAPTLAPRQDEEETIMVETTHDPVEEETEEYRIRRGFASTLAAMGFEFELCMVALENSRNDPNLAVEWLMGPAAAEYQERQQAQRIAVATMESRRTANMASRRGEQTLEEKAEELQGISGMPLRLAVGALELFNGDPNRAMEWLMEHGARYGDMMEYVALRDDDLQHKRELALSDEAALDEAEAMDLLVTNSSQESGVNIDSREGSADNDGENSNIMAVTLAPILAPLPEEASNRARKEGKDVLAGYHPLAPDYLKPYVLLTVSRDVGPVLNLSTSGSTGIFRMYSPDDGILLTFLNPETGAYEDEWHSPKDLRRITHVYDEPLRSAKSIHSVALRTEIALSTHYARRVMTVLMKAWSNSSVVHGMSRASFCETILKVVGGSRQFVKLLKLVVASDLATLRRSSGGPTFRSAVGAEAKRASRGKLGASTSVLHELQSITLQILQEEAQSGKLQTMTWLWPTSRVSADSCVRTCVSAASSRLAEAAASRTERCMDVEEMKEDQGVASSEMPRPATPRPTSSRSSSSRSEADIPTESFEQPTQGTGAFATVTADILSCALVKECVTNFVESTRVAGEGFARTTISTDHVQEFESLHPYFGRCEYCRHVLLDAPSRHLRVQFDSRCKLGPSSKLVFFADSKFEKPLLTMDFKTTSTTGSAPDLVIRSHQFWFRFIATEEDITKDYGYGYRFRVEPMSSISWCNEQEVLSTPSLEWACWLLQFLLNEADELVARGAVHNRKVFGALVRYLRSPGAQFKTMVVRLLVQLLSQPELFPSSEVPELDTLESIGRIALQRAISKKEAGQQFISAHLLQLVELFLATRRAGKVFGKRTGYCVEPAFSQFDLVMPLMLEVRQVEDVLADVTTLVDFLLGEATSLPSHILVSLWLDVFGCTEIVETPHPYTASTMLSGRIEFNGSRALIVSFDSRCATATESPLQLRNSSSPSASRSTTSSHHARCDPIKQYAGGDIWPSNVGDFAGETLEYSFLGAENTESLFGVGMCVTAVGLSREQQLARASVAQIELLLSRLRQHVAGSEGDGGWSFLMDSQLVDWVNNSVENGSAGGASSVELKPSEIRIHHVLDGLRCSQLLGVSMVDIQLRFALLKYLNRCIKVCLPLLDLRDASLPWTIAAKLRRLGHCLFFDIKNAQVDAAVDATIVAGDTNSSSSNVARITLDRLQALESRDDREVEPSVSECFFAQAFRQLHHVDPSLFRRKIDNKGRLFSVKFRGEEGVDWGGVYREGVNSMVDDLFSPHFNLFVLCPNGQHDTGVNRGMYLPNPKCVSPVAMQMFEFVGKLLGISLRTRGDFPFAFPSLVWKQLIGQPLELSDIEGTDAMLVQMLDGIQNCTRDGITTDLEFDAAFEGLDLHFTAFDCNGQEIELIDGGKAQRVTFANRLEYCQLVHEYRLYEGAKQIAAMARGLATIFPLRVLTLLTWQEMEMLTCGSPRIDIALWKKHTRYDGYSESDETVKLFWEAMTSFTDEQRSDFVRFAWGRSRLPRGKWPQPFKLTKKGGRDSTLSLPVAHTCFFSVELPPYTSLETMRSMLLATINFGLGGILMA